MREEERKCVCIMTGCYECYSARVFIMNALNDQCQEALRMILIKRTQARASMWCAQELVHGMQGKVKELSHNLKKAQAEQDMACRVAEQNQKELDKLEKVVFNASPRSCISPSSGRQCIQWQWQAIHPTKSPFKCHAEDLQLHCIMDMGYLRLHGTQVA